MLYHKVVPSRCREVYNNLASIRDSTAGEPKDLFGLCHGGQDSKIEGYDNAGTKGAQLSTCFVFSCNSVSCIGVSSCSGGKNNLLS